MAEAETPSMQCIIADPAAGPLAVPVREVSAQGAVLKTAMTFQENEYIDIALENASGDRHSLFAHVIKSGDAGLELRWLHFDPSEEQKLVAFLQGKDAGVDNTLDYAERADREEKATSDRLAAGEKKGTRRIVKPKDTSGRLKIEESAANNANVKKNTRRVVKPKNKQADDDDEFAPSEAPEIGSGILPVVNENTHNVVIASTQKFESMQDLREEKRKQSESAKLKAKAKKKSASSEGDGTKRITRRMNVVGDNGQLDVGASIRSKAKTVNAAELAARHEQVRVLNMSTIKGLIQDAVAEAVERLGASLEESEKKALLEEAEEQFKERLKEFNAEKKGIEEQAKVYQEQLEKAEKLLNTEKKKAVAANQFVVSDAGMADLMKAMDRLIKRAEREDGVSANVAEEIQKIMAKSLDDEREKIAEQAAKAQNEAIALLEKKVKRLANTLDETESERDRAKRMVQALEASGGGGGGVKNVIDVGLAEDDPQKEAKKALLKNIFEENQAMRNHLKKSGKKIPQRKRPAKPKPVVEEKPAEATEATPEKVEEKPTLSEAPLAEESISDVDSASEEVDPDDLPWGGADDTASADDDEEDDTGVKKISGFKDFAPPPLDRGGNSGDTESETNPNSEEESDVPETDAFAGEEIDPDDMMWEPGGNDDSDDEDDDNPVKKITGFDNFEPPPLQR